MPANGNPRRTPHYPAFSGILPMWKGDMRLNPTRCARRRSSRSCWLVAIGGAGLLLALAWLLWSPGSAAANRPAPAADTAAPLVPAQQDRPTPIPFDTDTPTPTSTPVDTATPTATDTPGPTATPSATGTPGPTATPSATGTPGPTATPTITNTAGPSPTPSNTAVPPPRGGGGGGGGDDDDDDDAVVPATQGRITGTVIDQVTGAPVPGVTVRIGDAYVATDANGNYELTGLPAGTYEIELILTPEQGIPAQPILSVSVPANGTAVQNLFLSSEGLPRTPVTAGLAATIAAAGPPSNAPNEPPDGPLALPDELPATGGPASAAASEEQVPVVWVLLTALLAGSAAGLWHLVFRTRR
jgi:hypothetical protein